MTSTPEPSPVPPRSGCLTAFMVMVGVILLLPGLCAIIFAGLALQGPGSVSSAESGLITLGFLVGAVGVIIIIAATRSLRR